MIAPLTTVTDAACISRTLHDLGGVNWVNHQTTPDGWTRWTYGLGQPAISTPPIGPWAALTVEETPVRQVTHAIQHPKYQSVEDHARSIKLMHQASEALHRECGLPSGADYSAV